MADNNDERNTIRKLEDLSAEEASRLDHLCDCFEHQLVARQKPSITSFIDGCRAPLRTLVFRELLSLELEFLQTIRLPRVLQDYVTRFPDYADIVYELFDDKISTTINDEIPMETPHSIDGSQIPNYTLLSELGSGGMGTVYRGIHQMLKNNVAIKVLNTASKDDDELRHLFQRETSNLGQLRHPHVVQALYAGSTKDGQQYLVMEFVKGMDLSQVVRRCGPISVATACEIARQAALGLQHASECGMVHRDIKPSNLLLGWVQSDAAEIKVADFGLARIRFHNAQKGLESDDARVGTLEYMPPEQFFNPSAVDVRADIFSLGCTLYALLVGQPPFAGKYQSAMEKMIVHRDEPVPSFRHLRPDVPEALTDAITWSMAKDPAERFESPLSFAKSLALFSGGHDLPLLLETAEERPDPLTTPLLVDSTFTLKPQW